MNKYSGYKDSKVEWIGDIPMHWDCASIKRFCQVKRGASPRPIDDPKYFDDEGEYSWVRISDVTASKKFLKTTTQRLSEEGARYSVKRYPGDLFLSIAATVGKPIITQIKCCIHDGFVWFNDLKINSEYLYYIFDSGQAYLGLGKLGTQLNLNSDTVGSIKIPVPRPNEQQDIVTFLDRKTHEIDSLIETKQDFIKKLQEKRTALISHAVTKGLNPNCAMKDSGIEWIGDIPQSWDVKKIKYISKSVQTGITPPSDNDEYYEDGNINWYAPGDFNDSLYLGEANRKITNHAIKDKVAKIFPANTIFIIGIGATVGKTIISAGECSSNQQLNAIILKSGYDSRFYTYFLRSAKDPIVSTTSSATLPILNQEKTKSIKCLIPPTNEACDIANYLDIECERIEKLIKNISIAIKRLQEYRTSLISSVVTGKIKVTGDSNE